MRFWYGSASLARRLSAWLAMLTLAVLAAVSVTVYFTMATHLHKRQTKLLEREATVVTHIVEEALRANDLPGLRHRLDDLRADYADVMSVDVSDPRGVPLYLTVAAEISFPDKARTLAFARAGPAGAAGGFSVKMSLGTGLDDALLHRLTAVLVATSLLGSLVVALAGLIVVRGGLRPVADLTNQTEGLTANTLRTRLDGSGQPRELQPLVVQFNRLLERIEHAYEQMEGFNADVAHELNTPLATLIASTELALRGERDAREQQERLGCNLEELRRMSGIVRDMLFLSRAERGALARRTEVASLAAVAAEVTDYHEAAFAQAGIGVDIDGNARGGFDVSLFQRALSNLLGNASRYADRGSTVRIEIHQTRRGLARVAVINRGQPIVAEHLPRLFDRFYRVDTSRSGSESHSGLGLAIVAAIARMHGGEPFAHSRHRITMVGMTVTTH